jgi:hypothetical protein
MLAPLIDWAGGSRQLVNVKTAGHMVRRLMSTDDAPP